MQKIKKVRGASHKSKVQESPKSKVQLASRAELKKWGNIGVRSVAAATRCGKQAASREDNLRPPQDNDGGKTMGSNQANWRPREGGAEIFGMARNDAANILTGRSWNAIAGLQRYNEKLVAMAQTNINLTVDFFWRSATVKSPSEFITIATEHARRRYETLNEQANELVALAQGFALGSTQPIAQPASKVFDKAA